LFNKSLRKLKKKKGKKKGNLLQKNNF